MVSEYNKPLPDAFVDYEAEALDGPSPIKPLVELEMTRFSAEWRRKPSWWTQCRDETILNKWRAEGLAQADLMDESHVEYVLKELDGYTNLRDEASGAEVSCYDKIWQSDTLIPPSLKERLIADVAKLEDIPESEKDWHPHSNGQVLHLVHPLLYPIVYGRTLSYPEDSGDRSPTALQVRLKAREPEGTRRIYYVSERCQWLPTDFRVSEDGTLVQSASYINNLHPVKHKDLYKAIEGLIAAYIPLFERVLTDTIPENEVIKERTINRCLYDLENYSAPPRYQDYLSDKKFRQDYLRWKEGRPTIVPYLKNGGYKAGSLEGRQIKYTLRGRTIQVIVKLANIYLTPDKPEFGGGSWHVEGMRNDTIAASGVYYYDDENISESSLGFRTACGHPDKGGYIDERGLMTIWGLEEDGPYVNELGSVIIREDRCIAYPNIYQRRVSPVELADKSKPGHRKMIALFLVDPAVQRPSTTTVPPQQAEWRTSGISANPVFNKLAPEIIDHIDSMVEGTMTREEAEVYRLEFTDERKKFIEEDNEMFYS